MLFEFRSFPEFRSSPLLLQAVVYSDGCERERIADLREVVSPPPRGEIARSGVGVKRGFDSQGTALFPSVFSRELKLISLIRFQLVQEGLGWW